MMIAEIIFDQIRQTFVNSKIDIDDFCISLSNERNKGGVKGWKNDILVFNAKFEKNDFSLIKRIFLNKIVKEFKKRKNKEVKEIALFVYLKDPSGTPRRTDNKTKNYDLFVKDSDNLFVEFNI